MQQYKKIIAYRRPSRYEPGKVVNVILAEPTSSHSLASLVLLTDYYRGLEAKGYADKFNINLFDDYYKELSNYNLLTILRRHFNQMFLSKSNLRCGYCNKEIVIRNSTRQLHDSATIDHKVPLLEDPDWFDETNLVACCGKCNNEKGDMPYQEWLNKINK